MDVLGNADALLAIVRLVLAEAGERVEPHGEIVEILAVAVRRFADAVAALPAEHAVDVDHEIARRIEPALLARFAEQRNVEHETEGIGPQIPQAIGPDALAAHPVELADDIIEVAQRHAGPPCDQ